MLRAHANMPAADFIAQLRTYVVAMGLSPQVVDCVDSLCGVDDLQVAHEKDLQETKDRVTKETKEAILQDMNHWLENQENYDLIKAPCEALIKIVEDA